MFIFENKDGVKVTPVAGKVNEPAILVRGVRTLPAVTFSWVRGECTDLTAEQATAATAAGAKVNHYNGKSWCYATRVRSGEADRQVVSFCNFRRYGWCWSTAALGADEPVAFLPYGYASGPIYANGVDGGLRAGDASQVVRDTLLRAIADLPVPEELKGSGQARRVFEELLADALANTSLHASSPVGSKEYDMAGLVVTRE